MPKSIFDVCDCAGVLKRKFYSKEVYKNNWFFTLRANSSTSKTCTFTSLPTFLYYHTLSFCPLHLSSIPGPKLDPCVRKGASNAITILYSSTTTLCTTSLHRPGTDHVRAAGGKEAMLASNLYGLPIQKNGLWNNGSGSSITKRFRLHKKDQISQNNWV